MSVRLPRTRKGKQKNNDHLFFFFSHLLYTRTHRGGTPHDRSLFVEFVEYVVNRGRCCHSCRIEETILHTHTHTQKKKKRKRGSFSLRVFFFGMSFPFLFLFGFFCVAYYWLLLVFLLSLSVHHFFPCILCFLLHECRAFCALCCCSLARGVLGSRTAAVLEVHSSTCGDGYACHRSFFEDALLMECFCGSEAKREGTKRG